MSALVMHLADHAPRRSPQLEDGFTRIANELYDALAGADLTERELRIVHQIIRMTYGYGRKQDDIAASQIGFVCRMATSHVTSALNSLQRKNVIHKRRGEHGCVIGLQKDYSLWPMREMPPEYTDPKFGKKRNGRPTKEFYTPEEPAEIPAHAFEKPPTDSVVGFEEKGETPYRIGGNPLPIPSKPPTDSVDTKESKPKKVNQRKNLSAPQAMPVRFEEFWNLYPRPENRKAAVQAWDRIEGMDDALACRIIASVVEHANTRQWKQGIYPHGSSFLNGRRWEDMLRTDYSDAERTVLRNYNEMIGAKINVFIEEDAFSEERAQLARACLADLQQIVGHPERGEYSARYFTFILQQCAPDKLRYMTPQWVMRNVAKAVNKDFSR